MFTTAATRVMASHSSKGRSSGFGERNVGRGCRRDWITHPANAAKNTRRPAVRVVPPTWYENGTGTRNVVRTTRSSPAHGLQRQMPTAANPTSTATGRAATMASSPTAAAVRAFTGCSGSGAVHREGDHGGQAESEDARHGEVAGGVARVAHCHWRLKRAQNDLFVSGGTVAAEGGELSLQVGDNPLGHGLGVGTAAELDGDLKVEGGGGYGDSDVGSQILQGHTDAGLVLDLLEHLITRGQAGEGRHHPVELVHRLLAEAGVDQESRLVDGDHRGRCRCDGGGGSESSRHTQAEDGTDEEQHPPPAHHSPDALPTDPEL